jgi:hypothetical protein
MIHDEDACDEWRLHRGPTEATGRSRVPFGPSISATACECSDSLLGFPNPGEATKQ